MNIQDLQTTAFLADLNVMENNLKRAADAASKCQKQIWPMIKTHKSTDPDHSESFMFECQSDILAGRCPRKYCRSYILRGYARKQHD